MLSPDEAVDVAKVLLGAYRAEYKTLHEIHEYVEGEPRRPYMPKDAKTEFRWIAEQSQVNYLPKVIDSHVSSLFVDGYRSPETTDNLPAWSQWQSNRMDARQTGVHFAALEYGFAFVSVLPGDKGPAWQPFSPRQMTCAYADTVNDEWPEWALTVARKGDGLGVSLLGPEYRYLFTAKDVDSAPEFAGQERHGVPWTPVVRFVSEFVLDDAPEGLVRPLMPLQDQINLTTFNGLVAQVYGAFKQKWVTGFDVPKDESGRPIEPFKAAVSRLWVAEGEATKFGQFDSEDLAGFLAWREDTVRALCTTADVPPHTILGALANLSSEALAAAEISKTRAEDVWRLLFGESWEQCFRLSRWISGDAAAVDDVSAQVVWRDTEARSAAQMVDAAVKLKSIGFPTRYIAEMLGVAPQDIPQLLDDIDAETTQQAVAQARSFGVVTDAGV